MRVFLMVCLVVLARSQDKREMAEENETEMTNDDEMESKWLLFNRFYFIL